MGVALALFLFLIAINGLILAGILRQKRLLDLEKRAKIEAHNSLFRFRNWRDR